ncbi:MAG: hypothetical protein V1836_04445 [Candidatus Aenigmatarchaeota archaeon]
MSVSPTQAEGLSGSVTRYVITIRNLESVTDRFLLSYSGTYSSWLTIENNNVVVPAGGEATVTLSVNPPIGINPSVYRYVVKAESAENPSVIGSAEFFFTVNFKYPLIITDFKLDSSTYNPGSDITASIKVANLAVTDLEGFSLDITLTDPLNGQKGVTVPIGLKGLEEKTVQKVIQLDKYTMPGQYKAFVELKSQANEQVSQNRTSFSVNNFYNVLQEKLVQKTFSGKTVIITVSNEGNMVAKNVTVREDLSSLVSWLAVPETAPTNTISSDGDVAYIWTIDQLASGQSKVVVYRISYTPAIVIAAFLIIGAIVIFIQMQKPRIFKRVLHVGPAQIGKEFTVTIGIKNSSRYTLKSAIIRDLVPPVLRLIPQHDTMKPLVKKTAVGTEMIWKLGDIRPQEERIITYKLSPVMGILGTVSLPKAYLRYRDANENSIRIFSNYGELGEVEKKVEE